MCARPDPLARTLWSLLAVVLLACTLGSGCNGPGLEPPGGDDGLSAPRGPQGEHDAGVPSAGTSGAGGSGAAPGAGGRSGAGSGASGAGGGAGGTPSDAGGEQGDGGRVSMRTKMPARLSHNLQLPRWHARSGALARLVLLRLGALLLASCIGPGLEPPDGDRATGGRNVTPPGAPAMDASTGPGFGNSGSSNDGETMSPDPTETPDTDPDPQVPPATDPGAAQDADGGTDNADEPP